MADSKLQLLNVTSDMRGLYTCVGSNQEGDGQSNALNLNVQCKCWRVFMYLWLVRFSKLFVHFVMYWLELVMPPRLIFMLFLFVVLMILHVTITHLAITVPSFITKQVITLLLLLQLLLIILLFCCC